MDRGNTLVRLDRMIRYLTKVKAAQGTVTLAS
jgi:hypothetical protein